MKDRKINNSVGFVEVIRFQVTWHISKPTVPFPPKTRVNIEINHTLNLSMNTY